MTFYLVDACEEVGPKDRVCCARCFADSTVKALEIEAPDAEVRCAYCGRQAKTRKATR